MSVDLSMILAVLAIFANIATVWKFGAQVGKYLEIVEGLKVDLNRAHEKVRLLESANKTAEKDIVEMKSDLKHILKSVEELKAAFNEKYGGCI